MGRRNTRAEIHEKLSRKMEMGKGLLIAAAGSGLNAKVAEAGGTDVLMVLHTGRMRQMGLPSIATPPKDPAEMVREMFPEQFFATREIPILAGITVSSYASDADLDGILDEFLSMGASGFVNFLSSGAGGSEEFLATARRDVEEEDPGDQLARLRVAAEREMVRECREKETRGVGFAREVELIRRCHERDLFSLTYVFSPEQAARMAAAGADGIIPHCGGTTGGMVGHSAALDYGDAARRIQEMFDAARRVNPQVLLLGHGGPFADPEDVVQMYRLTNAQGFVAGSGVDRLPIERGILETCRRFGEAKQTIK